MKNKIRKEEISKYKYIYKIYFTDRIINIEKFPIVYISKRACYYSDGTGYLVKVEATKLHTKNDISYICSEIVRNNYYQNNPWKTFYIISENKINTEIRQITKTNNRNIIIDQIKVLMDKLKEMNEE